MASATVAMRCVEFNVYEVKLAIPYATLGDDLIGKLPHGFDRTFKHHCFQALRVMQIDLHRSKHQIVMPMLDSGKSLGEFSFAVVVEVRDCRDAVTTIAAHLDALLQALTQQIPHGFAPSSIAVLCD